MISMPNIPNLIEKDNELAHTPYINFQKIKI